MSWIPLALLVSGAVLATALLSSLITLWLLRRAVERDLQPRLERLLEERLSGAIEGLGDVVQERVRRGVVDGVRSLPAPNLFHETRRSVQRTASDLVKDGLSGFFGPEKRRPAGPPGGGEPEDDE